MRFRHLHTTIFRSSKNRAITNAPPPQKPRRLFAPPATKKPPTMPSSNIFTDSDIVKCNVAIRNHLRHRQFDAALRLFNSMPRKCTISYNTMISGYLSSGKFKQAQQLFDKMPVKDLFTHNIMIRGNIKNRDLGAARRLFDEMPKKDVVSWNTILSGYVQNGFLDEAKRVFYEMPKKDVVSWNTVLSGYVQNGFMDEAKKVFDEMPMKDVVSWTTVLSGYAQNGFMYKARRVFNEMPVKDIFSWNTILSGYVQNGFLDEAKRVFDEMPMKDVVSWTTMVSGYAQNGFMDEARRVFNEMPVKDVVSWNTILSGYMQNGFLDEAKRVFDEMPEKDVVSWTTMVSGYAHNGFMDEARRVFNEMPVKDVVSWNAMITGYAQNDAIAKARDLFDRMPRRDCFSWAAIIAGYSQNGDSEEALLIFSEATRDRGRLSTTAFSSALSSCADITATELGKQIHGRVVKEGVEFGCCVGNALVSMYCRCGSINEAYTVFKRIEDKDAISWNTIIVGYARHGFSHEALQHFESMKQSSIQPNEVTMAGVLIACCHTGLVDKAKHYFYSMSQDHGIVADLKHYTCMIDLLGQAGLLDEAQNLMKSMPFEPDAVTWGALLSARRIHGNTELGEKAAEMISALEPWNSGTYVLLSNLYAASGRWEDAKKMRVRMRDSGVGKTPGYSWVEVLDMVHTFCAGDFTHPESEGICALLDELDLRMREDGYVPATKSVLHDVEEEEKQRTLRYHSERLAVAYGIMKIPSGRPIRVFKNLRVCEDCHVAMKHIARITGRLIVLRDANRFHHFEGGVCNCGDYW